MVSPSLTTVAQPQEQLGRAGVDLLLQLLEDPDRAAAARRELPSQLMVRHSTGRAPTHPAERANGPHPGPQKGIRHVPAPREALHRDRVLARPVPGRRLRRPDEVDPGPGQPAATCR